MFNLNQKTESGEPRPIAVKLPIGSSVEEVEVRWPTDQEWCDRVRRYKIVHSATGRSWRRESDNQLAVSKELFDRVCLNGHAETIDEAEAAYVVARLERAECFGIERAGSEFTVRLRVASGTTTHRLRAPRQKQILEYRRAIAPSPVTRNGKIESRGRLEPSGQLYDELVIAPAEGYAAEVPIVHKDAVLSALITEIDAITQEEDDDPEE